MLLTSSTSIKMSSPRTYGWAAPAAGGPGSKALTPEQRELDREARLTISAELGHEREQITAVYLGR